MHNHVVPALPGMDMEMLGQNGLTEALPGRVEKPPLDHCLREVMEGKIRISDQEERAFQADGTIGIKANKHG